MSNGKELFGLDKEIDERIKAKYDPALEQEAKDWISEITGETIEGNFWKGLKDGVILCKLVNVIKPGSISRFTPRPKHWLEERDNIKRYIAAVHAMGVPDHDLVSEADFTDSGRDEGTVLSHIYALARQAQVVGFNGPRLGVRFYKTEEDFRRIEERKQREREEERIYQKQKDIKQRERREFLEMRKKEHHRQRSDDAMRRINLRQSDRAERGRKLVKATSIKGKEAFEHAYNKTPSPVKYGLDLEISETVEERFNHEMAAQVMDWIEDLCGVEVDDFWVSLRSGKVLCQVMNKIQPGIIPRVHTRIMPLLNRENIQSFLSACERLGVKKNDLFSVNELYEAKDLNSVLKTIFALNRVLDGLPGYIGPVMDVSRGNVTRREVDNTPRPVYTHTENVPPPVASPVPPPVAPTRRSLLRMVLQGTAIAASVAVAAGAGYVGYVYYTQGLEGVHALQHMAEEYGRQSAAIVVSSAKNVTGALQDKVVTIYKHRQDYFDAGSNLASRVSTYCADTVAYIRNQVNVTAIREALPSFNLTAMSESFNVTAIRESINVTAIRESINVTAIRESANATAVALKKAIGLE